MGARQGVTGSEGKVEGTATAADPTAGRPPPAGLPPPPAGPFPPLRPVADDGHRRSLRTGAIAFLLVALGIALAVVVVLAVLAGLIAFGLSSLDVRSDPGKGTDSRRLAVTVTPRTGLQPDQVVRVRSRAFAANGVVAVAQCLRSADTRSRGIDACDTDGGSRFAVDATGELDLPYRVRQTITVHGRSVDCARVEGGCLVVAADADDYDRSGGQRITFAPGTPAGRTAATTGRPLSLLLPATATPAGPYARATYVRVNAFGFVPDEPVLLAWCTGELPAAAAAKEVPTGEVDPTRCEPASSEAVGAIMTRSVERVSRHADGNGAVSATIQAKRSIQPISGSRVVCDRPKRCALVVVSAADLQRSAVVPYVVTD